MHTDALRTQATHLLERWATAAEEYWYDAGGEPATGCYGPGYLTWGVQSNWNYLGAMATLAAQPGVARAAHWQARALAALRFLFRTHVTGDRPGLDGKPWGHGWISMLGIERAMHGVACLAPALTAADRAALHRVLTSEVDWLLFHASRGRATGVCAGLWASGGCNNPENNIWSGALLWRVATMYPDEPHAAAWQEQAHRFLINGVSIPADAQDRTVVAGRPVAERHVGANFFPHYALDHHGYLNVGYMAICVSNAAMLHFDLKRAGQPAPASLYHHQADLWQVLRRFVFADGRLARVGGDSRVRYAYCQEYLLPSLLFAADHCRDTQALPQAARQVVLMAQEADAPGGSGLFYAHRLAAMRARNPHYFTRLESDRACVLAMLLNYLPLVNAPAAPTETFEASVAGGWAEDAHGAAMHRSPTRFASVSWRAHGLTNALCLPPGDSDLAEWSLNLAPVVRFLGDDGQQSGRHRRVLAHQVREFAGGFVTSGAVMEGANIGIDEGGQCTDQATTQLAFAALPDGRTCLALQYVVAASDRRSFLMELKDLHLGVPNDVFNGNRRTLHTATGQSELPAPSSRDEVLATGGRWLNVDDRLGVVALHGGEQLLVARSATRRGGRYQSLHVEEVCLHVRQGVAAVPPGAVLVDVGFAVLAGATARDTGTVAAGSGALALPDGLRGVWITGADGQRYALIANVGATPATAEVLGATVPLAPGAAALVGPRGVLG